MQMNDFPTRRNLYNAKNALKLARTGYDLIDKKHRVLTTKLKDEQKHRNALHQKLEGSLVKAKESISYSLNNLGTKSLHKISNCIPKTNNLTLEVYSIMGLSLPLVNRNKLNISPLFFDLSETSTCLDITIQNWNDVMDNIIAFSQAELTCKALFVEIKKCMKRASALNNILIPRLEGKIKYISEQLEERERDETIRSFIFCAKDKHLV